MSRLLSVSALVLLLVFLLAAVAASPIGRDSLTNFALRQIPLNDGYALAVGETTGSILKSLSLLDLQLTDPDGDTIAHIDTATIELELLPLLQRQVSLRSLDIRNPQVHAEQQVSGRWNLADAFLVESTGKSTAVRISSASLRGGSVSATYSSTGTDSTFSADDIVVVATRMAFPDELQFDLQELHGRFVPPGLREPAYLRVVAGMTDSHLRLDTLLIASPRTNLRASGRTIVSGTRQSQTGETPSFLRRLNDVDLTLYADPVAFTDLAPFFPGLDTRSTGSIDLRANGSMDDAILKLSADFGIDGSVEADARISISPTDSIAVSAESSFDGLRPAMLRTSTFRRDDVITGQLSVILDGPSSDGLTGTIGMDFDDTSLPSFMLSEPTLQVRFDAGDARYQGSVLVAQQPIRVSGAGRPLDSLATYSGELATTDFDVSAIGPEWIAWKTSLTGSLVLEGSGFAQPSIDASLNLLDSRINRFQLSSGGVDALIRNDAVDVSARLIGPSGNAVASGSIDDIRAPEWELKSLQATNVDVSALIDDTTALAVTGSAFAAGAGWNVGSMEVRGEIAIDSAAYNSIGVRDLTVAVRKEGQNIAFQQRGTVDNVRLESEGSVAIGATKRLSIHSGRFEELDIGSYVDRQTSHLNGTVQADLSGSELAAMNGRLNVTLEESALNSMTINNGTGQLIVRNGEIDYQLDVRSDSGRVALAGVVNPFDTVPSIHVDRSTIERFDVGAATGIPKLSSRLSGSLTGMISGTSLPELRGDGILRLNNSQVNGTGAITGAISVNATDTMTAAVADLRWQNGGLAEGFVKRRPGDANEGYLHEMRLAIEHLDIGSWLAVDTVTTDISTAFSGSFGGRTLKTMHGTGNLERLSGHYQDIQLLSGSGAFELAQGVLVVDRTAVNTSAGALAAEGTVALLNTPTAGESDLSFEATITSLKPFGAIVPRVGALNGSGRVLGQVTGPPQSLYATATVDLQSLEYRNRRVSSVEGTLEASLDASRKLSMLDASAEIHNAILPTLAVQESSVHAALVDSVFQFEGISTADDRRSLRISGTLDPRADRRSLTVDDLSVRVDADRWELLQPSTITYGAGLRVKNLLLFTDDQQIALDGIVNLNGEQSLILTVENFRIASVADLFDYSGLGGTVNGYLDLAGPADAPIVEGDLSFDVRSNNVAVGDMQLSLRYDDLLLYPDALFRHVDGSSLTIKGELPIDLRLTQSSGPTPTGVRVASRQARLDKEVDLAIVADSFSMGWMLPFLDKIQYDRLSGRFDGLLDVTGTVQNPTLSGAATVVDGEIGLPQFGIRPNNISADLEFDGNQIQIAHAQGVSG
ncbi:MAG: hypothetical protein HKN13_11695, partial [Rhodothermales bacterium]|nr:hypothetical protein [Rhodothermales bacterium]